jgi:hypothetical protein
VRTASAGRGEERAVEQRFEAREHGDVKSTVLARKPALLQPGLRQEYGRRGARADECGLEARLKASGESSRGSPGEMVHALVQCRARAG